jgi:hypothetical protein
LWGGKAGAPDDDVAVSTGVVDEDAGGAAIAAEGPFERLLLLCEEGEQGRGVEYSSGMRGENGGGVAEVVVDSTETEEIDALLGAWIVVLAAAALLALGADVAVLSMCWECCCCSGTGAAPTEKTGT